MPRVMYNGGPCSCAPGRYVRFIDPPGVPGLRPAVHCRDAELGERGLATHNPPLDMIYTIRVPRLT
jgi:hypothetical protein